MASSVNTPADWERAIIQIHRKAYHLRPEIAVSFDRSQSDALIVRPRRYAGAPSCFACGAATGQLMFGAPSVCREPGCVEIVRGKRCPAHPEPPPVRAPDRRPSAARRGYGAQHRRERAALLRRHPWCACGNPATVADHVVRRREGGVVLQPMCKPCHDRKTAGSDGGFGNPLR